MYGLPVLDAIVYGALLSLMLESSQRQTYFPKTPAVGLIAGLWIATILSHLPHTYFQGMINTTPETFKVCFFTLLLLVVIDRPDRVQKVILVFVVGAVVVAIHCLMQQRVGYGFAGEQPMVYFDPRRGGWISRSYFFGIFGDPNDTAQLLATAIPLVFAVPRRFNPITAMACGAVSWLLFLALQTTLSRGGQIALIVVISAILLMRMPTRWLPYIAVAGLLAGLVLVGIKGRALLDMSARERVDFWGLANQYFKQNPLFGLGYGMFWQVAGDRAAHNAFVSCYTEIGLVGYWFWFSLLQLGMIGCWRARRTLRAVRGEGQAYLRRAAGLSIAALAGFSAAGYFLSRSFAFPFYFLFGLLNAIPLIAQRYLPEEHPPLVNGRTDVLGMGTLSTLGSVVYIYVTILLLNR